MTLADASHQELEALWHAARAGDGPAVDVLVERTRAIAGQHFRASRIAAADVDDLIQETVVSLLRYLRGSAGPTPTNLPAFLKFRARGVAKEHFRHRARNRDSADVTQALLPADADATPFESLLRHELRQILVDCIGLLPDNQQRAWRQRLEGVVTARDIAPALGAKPAVVRTWLSRGSRSLADCVRGRIGGGGLS